MTNFVVSNGHEFTLFTLNSGDVMSVLSGGVSDETLVSSGGQLLVSSGGLSVSDTVFAGGVEVLSSGAIGSSLTVSSGGTLKGAGVLSGATVVSGLVSGLTIVSGTGGFGSMTVGSRGVASGVTVNDSYGFVQSGGVTRSVRAIGGSLLVVSAGGSATGTIEIAGTQDDYGSAQGTIVSNNSFERIYSGGTAAGAVISSGGQQIVSSGGLSTGTIVSNGGAEFIESGGVALSSHIASGGRESVMSGGSASAFTISSGGGLTVSSGGVVRVGTTGTSTNFGFIDVQSTAEMDLAGTLYNGGSIILDNSNTVEVNAASATLTGSGTIDMAASVLITGAASSDILDNESNTIEGTGQLGGESLTVINRGVIDANLASDLTLNATALTNTGLIEATNPSGGLVVFGPINNTGGVIEAKGAAIYLEAGASVSGGLLSEMGAGQFYVAGSAALNGAGQAVTNKAIVSVEDALQLTLDGAIANAGEISLASTADNTDLVIDGPTVTLTGSGLVVMSDNAANRIFGDATTFTNVLDNVNNTIEGAGQIGAGKLILDNGGTIDASGTANSLVIDTTSATNTGLIESTSNGGLVIEASINNSGGVIAADRGSVYLRDGAAIEGGTLSSIPMSDIFVTNSATLDGTASPLTNNGNVYVTDAAQLSLAGAIANNNLISLNADADVTGLVVTASTATLSGGGVLELSDTAFNQVYGATSADTLINVDNTIEGGGQIGEDQLRLVNSGTIDASGTNAALVINTTSTTNTGLIEATGGAGLVIESAINNAGGIIDANAGDIQLAAGAAVSGGTLSAASQGEFIVTGTGATLNGVSSQLSNSATVYVEDGVRFYLAGAIANDGDISLAGAADITDLVVSGATATLTGSGTIEFSDSAENRLYGATAADVLDNESDTIEGAGQIGVGQLTLINRGTIDATGATNALVIHTTSATNSGLMEATTAPGLVIESVIKNAGGVIAAFGGDVFVEQGAVISNGLFSGSNGGDDLIEVMSGGSVMGASVANGADEIVSSGAIQSGVSVLRGGVEEILIGETVSASIVRSGGLELIDAGAATSGATVSSGGVMAGPGLLEGTISDAGLVSAMTVVVGGTLNVLSGGVASDTTVSSGGGVIVSSGGSIMGTILLSGGRESLVSSGTASGTVVSSGGSEQVSAGGVTSNDVVLSAGAEVVFSGGLASGTTVSASGTLTISSGGSTSATTVLSGGRESVFLGGTATGAAISSGGDELVSSGGLTRAAVVQSGGLELVRAGVASGTTVFSGGTLTVSSGGSTTGTHLSGGREYLFAGGTESGTAVLTGGIDMVSSGGVTRNDAIRSGGEEIVFSGGAASGMVVSSGGTANLSLGGVAIGLSVLSGGVLIDNGSVSVAGGHLLAGSLSGSGSITETGTGALTLSGLGAAFKGQAVISGGVLELATAGAIGTGAVVFGTGSATLQIDAADSPAAGGTFANTLSNFSGANDFIDLRGIAFVSGATATVVGAQLVLTEGGKTYKFNLAGSIGGAFPVVSDGFGGTLIDPHVAGFAQAMASFGASGAAATSHPVSGGAMASSTPLFATGSGAR